MIRKAVGFPFLVVGATCIAVGVVASSLGQAIQGNEHRVY